MRERRLQASGKLPIAEQQAQWKPNGTHLDLAYLAGLFDGEGSIGVYEVRERFKFDVKLVGVNRASIERFQQVFGFGTFSRIKRPTKGGHIAFQWSCSFTFAQLFLR